MAVLPRIIDLHERELRTFPRIELFDNFGQSLILPETRALKAIDLRDVVDGVQLRALGLIGYLPLTATIILNLRPKFSVENLWHMISVADEDYDRILPVLRSYGMATASAPHLFLARGFAHFLKEILAIGIARGYQLEMYRGHYKPKVHFGETVSRHLSRGDEITVRSHVFSFSAGLQANAMLKAACLAFQRIIPRTPAWSEERLLLADALNALFSVQDVRMQFGDLKVAGALPVWIREAYLGALTVYAILLGLTKVGFRYEAQGSQMPSFLFSLDTIFESFVRNTFRGALRRASVSVLDGNLPRHQQALFRDNTRFPTKPDIIFKARGKSALALGEVKYKSELEEKDRYQLISHAVSYGVPTAIWISPAPSGDTAGLQYVGSIGQGTKFYHYQLNIAADLNESSAAMVSDVAKLLGIALS